jgi:hypothetical protein
MSKPNIDDIYAEAFEMVHNERNGVGKMKVKFLKSCKDFHKKFKKGEVAFIDDFRAVRFISMGDAKEFVEDDMSELVD